MPSPVTPIRVTLREAREAAGLTQRQLADLAEVRQATVSDIETGKHGGIDFEVLDRLCGALGVTPGELIVRDAPRSKRKRK